MSSLVQKGLGPEGGIVGERFRMAFLVIYESPQPMEGAVALGTHVGFEPRVGGVAISFSKSKSHSVVSDSL